ncbi:4Fe-4S binding protein [Magnetococcus sp. PR-3]|uniref:4Fe-4S binding protein n=1 Tax=Magnetococcus sp. PR-3 TaxID=3120355 RepID=UPI002FCE3792
MLTLLFTLSSGPVEAKSFRAYEVDFTWSEVFPGADRFSEPEGEPKAVKAFKGDALLGYAFIASEAVSAIGYSGKPIRVVVGVDLAGTIVGAKLIEHHEPILLVGIPEKKLLDFVARYIGMNVPEVIASNESGYDAISGATVTAIVVRESMLRGAMKVLRSRGAAGLKADGGTEKVELSNPTYSEKGWMDLLGDGSVRRLILTNREVDAAFERQKVEQAAFEDKPPADGVFIDLYASLITPDLIGRNLLGEQEFKNLNNWLAPGQQAILIMANGRYSFRGSGFVRGAIFDRFQLLQGDNSIIFRDKQYRRLGDLAPEDSPKFTEIGLFKIPEAYTFDPAKPWALELLAYRFKGAIEKAFTTFSLGYNPPEIYLKRTKLAASPEAMLAEEEALWQRIWKQRVWSIGILCAALLLLTWMFFYQAWLVKRPVLFNRLKYGFLTFTVVWIGYYAQAQLSVVNVLTFTNALAGGFRWDFFLLEPLVFILWIVVAVSLLFWGRGPYCGWLCPYGAMQEFMHLLARYLGFKQFHIKFNTHERLWPIKYLIFLGLLGVSFHSLAQAEFYAEVEPFKTAILLKFNREVIFVIWALAMLVASAFIYRFFCRYLCPLGAALAIPGRMRMFDWLKRRKQCGTECQICAKDCHIQAIHPEGPINPNECFYCMDCQVIYHDCSVCPPLVKGEAKRKRREEMKIKVAQQQAETKEAQADDAG